MSVRLSVLLALAAALALPAAAQGFTEEQGHRAGRRLLQRRGRGRDARRHRRRRGPAAGRQGGPRLHRAAQLVPRAVRRGGRERRLHEDDRPRRPALGDVPHPRGARRDRRRLRRPLAVHRADHHDGLARDVPHADGRRERRPALRLPLRAAAGARLRRLPGDLELRRVRHEPALRGHKARERVHVLRQRVAGPGRARAAGASHLRIDGHNAYGSYVAQLDLDPSGGYLAGSSSRASRRSRRRRPAGAARTS